MVDLTDHQPCNFVKGNPQSIISLLISEINWVYYIICIDALSYRVDWKHLLHIYHIFVQKVYFESYLGSRSSNFLALL
jgi:hypothetical protein